MHIAITADLHWGHNEHGDFATRLLAEHLQAHPPDLFLMGGDQGTADHFKQCLELFAELPCPKALVPGNHDLWTADQDARGDSLNIYQQHLPGLCNWYNYHYLDLGPLVLADAGLAIVGTINWYDYSWSLEKLRLATADYEWRLRQMQFSRGRHNDRRFVRWDLDDVSFTQLVVANFEKHLDEALEKVDKALVLAHHPPLYGLNFPRPVVDGEPSLDSLLWDAFSGNQAMEDLLARQADRLAAVFCGHTHRARENALGSVPAWNIGGDYHFKRLLVYEWPSGKMHDHFFGDPRGA